MQRERATGCHPYEVRTRERVIETKGTGRGRMGKHKESLKGKEERKGKECSKTEEKGKRKQSTKLGLIAGQ